jgi:hypothetical protein
MIVQRLAQGIEVLDAVRGERIVRALRVDLEGAWAPRGHTANSPYSRPAGWWERPGVTRHESGLHVLLYHPTIMALPATDRHVTVRIHDDHARRIVPRRLRLPLIDPQGLAADDLGLHPLAQRVRRPCVFPGAAYDFSARMTAVRGRVVRNKVPVPWTRVEARYPGHDVDYLAGVAHGDDRGEFLLLLGGHDNPYADPDDLIDVELRVYGPPAPAPADPFAALPLETLPAPDQPDTVSPGTTPPPGYVSAPPHPL